MKQILLLVSILIGLSGFAFSQAAEIKKIEKEITVCPVKLLVGAADFRFSYRYIAKTDSKGDVAEVKQISKDNPPFIKDKEFVSCIENWKLNPSEEYFISINVGTIFTDRYKNHILISGKTETIKIILPPVGEELTIEENKKK